MREVRPIPWLSLLPLLAACAAGCEATNLYASYVDQEEGDQCMGACVPKAPLGWSEPALVWAGPIDEAPECPDSAPGLGYEGYAGFGTAPIDCPACICEPPTAVACALPTTWTASGVTCGAPGGTTTSFDAPPGWNGSCTAQNGIPSNALCNGMPCVRSLTIEAPVVTPGSCTPKAMGPAAKEDPFTIFARACVGEAYLSCASAGETCAPAAAGFATCIYAVGDVACPTPWDDKRVYYAEILDNRGCTPCTCSPPEGATCKVAVTAYPDGACAGSIPFQTVVSSEDGAACLTVPTGTALGSKTASVIETTAGTCLPGESKPVGEAMPNAAATFCCLP